MDYRVVVNHEEQYSIWPADQGLPAGWRSDGDPGSRESCLQRIGEIWTDLRPLSVRGGSAQGDRTSAEAGQG